MMLNNGSLITITYSIPSVSNLSLLSFGPCWTLHTHTDAVVMVTVTLPVFQKYHQFQPLLDYQLIPIYHYI